MKGNDFDVLAAAAAVGLTVTSGAANVNVGRLSGFDDKPLAGEPPTACEAEAILLLAAAAAAAEGTATGGASCDFADDGGAAGVGSKLNLGKLETGKETAEISGSSGDSSVSLMLRIDSRTGTLTRALILPPACCETMGVLDARATAVADVMTGAGDG